MTHNLQRRRVAIDTAYTRGAEKIHLPYMISVWGVRGKWSS